MDKKTLKQLYPAGCRVVLDSMDDSQAPPPGTQASVVTVDDACQIICSWDTGSRLSLIPGIDRFHRICTEDEAKVTLDHIGQDQTDREHCPRCGAHITENNRLLALSRRADINICEMCGQLEALEDVGFVDRLSLLDWAVITDPG